jgi:hypothetical protein
MKAIVPSDTEFKEAFRNALVSKANLARYYLRVLESQAKGGQDQALTPNDNEQVVNLEHILPQNPSPDWGSLDPEAVGSYYNRIGNLALLKTAINSSIGNTGFLAKMPYYQDSPFQLTTELTQYTTWGPAEIDDRQAKLAELAVKAWPNKV